MLTTCKHQVKGEREAEGRITPIFYERTLRVQLDDFKSIEDVPFFRTSSIIEESIYELQVPKQSLRMFHSVVCGCRLIDPALSHVNSILSIAFCIETNRNPR